MIPSFFYSKLCKICQSKFRSRNNICNDCIAEAEEIIFQKEKNGIELKSHNPLLNEFCRMTMKLSYFGKY